MFTAAQCGLVLLSGEAVARRLTCDEVLSESRSRVVRFDEQVRTFVYEQILVEESDETATSEEEDGSDDDDQLDARLSLAISNRDQNVLRYRD